MNAAKLPNELSEDDYTDTNRYILLENIKIKNIL